MYEYFNPNPNQKRVGDCAIRALTKALNKEWNEVYLDLCVEGYLSSDLPSANFIWGNYLIKNGFKREVIPSNCPECYSINDFADTHPNGTFVVGTGSHAVAVVDGVIYDVWDSGAEQPIYFYHKEN